METDKERTANVRNSGPQKSNYYKYLLERAVAVRQTDSVSGSKRWIAIVTHRPFCSICICICICVNLSESAAAVCRFGSTLKEKRVDIKVTWQIQLNEVAKAFLFGSLPSKMHSSSYTYISISIYEHTISRSAHWKIENQLGDRSTKRELTFHIVHSIVVIRYSLRSQNAHR